MLFSVESLEKAGRWRTGSTAPRGNQAHVTVGWLTRTPRTRFSLSATSWRIRPNTVISGWYTRWRFGWRLWRLMPVWSLMFRITG